MENQIQDVNTTTDSTFVPQKDAQANPYQDTILSKSVTQLGEKIADSRFFKPIQTSLDEMEPKTRQQLSLLAYVLFFFGSLYFLYTQWDQSHTLSLDIQSKQELTSSIQQSAQELKSLKEQSGEAAFGSPIVLKSFLTDISENTGISTESMDAKNEKPAPAAASTNKDQDKNKTKPIETFADLILTKVNVKQLQKFLYEVENKGHPIKIRNLKIETEADQSGYLNATVAISYFTLPSPTGRP
jgi:type II secretory pathway component PulM